MMRRREARVLINTTDFDGYSTENVELKGSISVKKRAIN